MRKVAVTRSPAQLRREVIKPPFQAVVGIQDSDFGGLQDAIDTAQYGEWQDDILVLAAFEGIADQVGDAPDKVDLSL